MNKLIRKGLDKINPYVPGKPIDLVEREFGIKNAIKLASNENAFGASGKAKQAIRDSLDEIFRYPDGNCYYLKKALAKKLKLKPVNLIFGNGSDELIDIIIKTFLNRKEEVLTSQTTFVEYEIIAKANGFKARCVPLRDFRYDLKAMARSITGKTKIIFIANPNNPTGTYVTNDELLSFIKSLPENKLVVVDEAYSDFVEAKDFPKITNYIDSKNLIILRTFSKSYGLAGLRIGYCLARPEFIKAMEKIKQPFNVNFLAQRAAEAAISDSAFLAKSTKVIINEKNKLYKELESVDIEYVPSQGNFIMLKTRLDGLRLSIKLLKEGIIVRDLKQYNLNKHIRVSIGKPNENILFIQKLKKVLRGEK